MEMLKTKKNKRVNKYIMRALKIACLMITLIGGIISFRTWDAYATLPSDTNAGQESNDINDTHGDEERDITPFNLDIDLHNDTDEGTLSATLQIVLLLTILSIAPSFLIMLTSFTRIIIVLHFIRQALGTTTSPPNQVLVGLALFLTFYIMNPTFTAVYNNAIEPMTKGTVTAREAIDLGIEPLRDFMLSNVNKKDLKLFIKLADNEVTESYDEIPTTTLIPAFICSELRAAFIIGFLIYIPFIVIDMVVASTLMSMGMMMLPPTTISAPFKILLFVLADGWDLVIGNLVQTFH